MFKMVCLNCVSITLNKCTNSRAHKKTELNKKENGKVENKLSCSTCSVSVQITAKAAVSGSLGYVAIGEPYISKEKCEQLPATSKRGKRLVAWHITLGEESDFDVLLTLPQYGTPPWQIWVDTSRPHITRSTLQMTSTALGKFSCLWITSWGWSSWCSTSRTIRGVKMASCRSEMERIPFLLHLDDSVVTNFPKCLNHLRMRWKLNLRLHLWEASLKYPTLPGKVSVQVFRSCYFNRLY